MEEQVILEDRRKNIVLRGDILYIKEAVNNLIDKIKDFDKKIYGNGQKGMLDRLTVIETKLDDFIQNNEKNNDNKRYSFWQFATIGIATLGLFLSIVK